MWVMNCSERDAYGEKLLKKEEYLEKYDEYLLDEFWLAWGDNRRWIDGDWRLKEVRELCDIVGEDAI